jgi:hypothetical protein
MIALLISLLVLVSSFFLLILFVFVQNHITNDFQKNIQMHQLCCIYNGEEKLKGRIVSIFDDAITVEDEEGDIHNFHRTLVYPPSKFQMR